MLRETFTALITDYTTDNALKDTLFTEIEINYSRKNRYYHTLTHLENLLKELQEIKPMLSDWNTVLFSLYYHDIVYNPVKSNNEEKSADLAEKRLSAIKAPDAMIRHCKLQILATKKHQVNPDDDTNYFTDADLSVLGQDWETYANYADNVRKEYSIYPDLLYNPGRRKVLESFLAMERIFKTDHFFKKYELQAKRNLQQEIERLK